MTLNTPVIETTDKFDQYSIPVWEWWLGEIPAVVHGPLVQEPILAFCAQSVKRRYR